MAYCVCGWFMSFDVVERWIRWSTNQPDLQFGDLPVITWVRRYLKDQEFKTIAICIECPRGPGHPTVENGILFIGWAGEDSGSTPWRVRQIPTTPEAIRWRGSAIVRDEDLETMPWLKDNLRLVTVFDPYARYGWGPYYDIFPPKGYRPCVPKKLAKPETLVEKDVTPSQQASPPDQTQTASSKSTPRHYLARSMISFVLVYLFIALLSWSRLGVNVVAKEHRVL